MISLLYPSRTTVSEDQVLQWARDAHADHETEIFAETVPEAIHILEELGHITTASAPHVPTTVELAERDELFG